LIDNSVAVVVEAVADLDARYPGHAVLALATHADASAKAHSALRPNSLVDLPVAIVVEQIADFERVGMARGIELGAITGLGGVSGLRWTAERHGSGFRPVIAVTIRVRPHFQRARTFVHLTIAVVVTAIACLRGAGVNCIAAVVAIVVGWRVANWRRLAGAGEGACKVVRTQAVSVRVEVEGLRAATIDNGEDETTRCIARWLSVAVGCKPEQLEARRAGGLRTTPGEAKSHFSVCSRLGSGMGEAGCISLQALTSERDQISNAWIGHEQTTGAHRWRANRDGEGHRIARSDAHSIQCEVDARGHRVAVAWLAAPGHDAVPVCARHARAAEAYREYQCCQNGPLPGASMKRIRSQDRSSDQ
jgi:hypothetical protein